MEERFSHINPTVEVKSELNAISYKYNRTTNKHSNFNTKYINPKPSKLTSITCFYCAKGGHFKRDCRSFQRDKENHSVHKDNYSFEQRIIN